MAGVKRPFGALFTTVGRGNVLVGARDVIASAAAHLGARRVLPSGTLTPTAPPGHVIGPVRSSSQKEMTRS
jgi:hypothetical protein